MNVFVRSTAREDILRQFAWYLDVRDSPEIARRFLDAVEVAIQKIADRPKIGAPKWLDNPKLKGLRSWPVPRFPAVRVYYLCSDDELRIVRVLHGKRDLQSILQEDIPDEDEQ